MTQHMMTAAPAKMRTEKLSAIGQAAGDVTKGIMHSLTIQELKAVIQERDATIKALDTDRRELTGQVHDLREELTLEQHKNKGLVDLNERTNTSLANERRDRDLTNKKLDTVTVRYTELLQAMNSIAKMWGLRKGKKIRAVLDEAMRKAADASW